MNPSHPTAQFLRRHRHRARGTLLAWSAAATLAAAGFMGAAHLGWTTRGIEWALLPIFVAAFLLGVWFRRAPQLTPHRLAQELDTRWGLRARLESAVELGNQDSAWAARQRDDATQHLSGRKLPGAFFWFLGLLAVAVIFCLVSFEGSVIAVRALQKPAAPTPNATAKPGSATSAAAGGATSAATAPPAFQSAIEWKTPESEIKATAIEEVPLVAIADSTAGFRSASLEIAINGDREVSRPLDAPDLGGSTNPGAHEIKSSLYLDELDVKEGDLVTYRLVAELNTPDQQTASSAPQFVEIRRAQRDSELKGGTPSPIAVMLLELKSGQLQLLKQNYALIQQAPGASVDPSWNSDNARMAADQDALANRVDELLKLLAGARAPAAFVGKVKEAQSLMRDAAKQIAAKENEPGAKSQTRALAIITDLSKVIRNALSGPTLPVSDPFKDQQTFKLVPRAETPAGELEQLAARQEKNNSQLGSGGPGTRTEQEAIAQAAEKIGNAASLDPLTKAALDTGSAAAADAARQLGLNDPAAARVPAAAAQRAFEEAVAAQDKAGRAVAAAGLEQLRRALNVASRASAAERSQQMTQARDTLRAAANEQQLAGSADAARELAQLAALAATPGTASPERARELALAAAQVQVGLMPRAISLGRAVRLLRRAGQPGAGADSDVEIASQEAQWLSSETPTLELARQVATLADAAQTSGAASHPPSPEIVESAGKLAAALENGRSGRNELVRRFNPADVDPAYRTAVETYFERLSRDAPAAPHAPAK